MNLDPSRLGRLCRAREALADLDSRASVPEVAAIAAMSPFHFTRVFAAVFGLTPHQYRIGVQVREAKRLLRTSDRTVTEICFAVGFGSLGGFSALFSRRVGCSPTEYRRSALRHAHGCVDLLARLPPDAFRSFREAR